MQPKRKQGPLSAQRRGDMQMQSAHTAPRGPRFKVGDYVPMAILIFSDDKPKNVHVKNKLYALKDFDQNEALLAYHFQHPQQPAVLDPNRPDIGSFNGAVLNFCRWLVTNGYCREEVTPSDLTIRVWTHDEIVAAKVVEAEENNKRLTEMAAQIAGVDTANLQMEAPINVGTVGHVDHGQSTLNRSISDGGQAYDADKVGDALPTPVAYLDDQRPDHPLDALLVEQVEERVAQPAGETVSLEAMEAKFAEPVDDRGCLPPDLAPTAERTPDDLELMYPGNVKKLDIHNDDVRRSYPEGAISAAELIAADPKGGL